MFRFFLFGFAGAYLPILFLVYPAGSLILRRGGRYMRLRQRIRVNVSRPDGGKEAVLETARGKLRSRLLRRLVGDQYAVLVLTPVGMHVDSVEIHETGGSGDE